MKYIDPDTYKQQRVDAIRTMVYTTGKGLPAFERRYGVDQNAISRILSPYINVTARTVDKIYKAVYKAVDEPIDVNGAEYEVWYKELFDIIVEYQQSIGASDREFCKIVDMNATIYYKYKRGDSKARDETLWNAFCIVRNRVRQLR